MSISLDICEQKENKEKTAGTDSAGRRCSPRFATFPLWTRSPENESHAMTILLLALLAAFALATVFVLADSGLRLWSASQGIETRRGELSRKAPATPQRLWTARMTTRVSYARLNPVELNGQPLRVAA